MTVKDLDKAGHSIFIVAIVLIVLVGVGIITIIANSEETSVSDQSTRGDSNVVTGVVEELFEDCVRAESFEDGEVVPNPAITCDGGSYIVVGEQRIQTSAGFVVADQYFEVSISELQAGDTVEVIYNERSPGIYDLNCDSCAIRPL